MKNLKKLVSSFLVVAMLLSVFLISSTEVQASSKGTVPSKVRIYVQSQDSDAIEFDYLAYGDSIKNLKTSNKNLKAKQTLEYQMTDDDSSTSYAAIGLYASKKGKYKVSFDIYGADGIKKSSHSVTVYAYSDLALKSLKVNGKDLMGITKEGVNPSVMTKSAGKIKVALNSGYKLKKVEYGVYTADGKLTYNTFKNGRKITFGTIPSKYSYQYVSSHSSYKINEWSTTLFATTYIKVTYTDKYTKQQYYTIYPLLRWAD